MNHSPRKPTLTQSLIIVAGIAFALIKTWPVMRQYEQTTEWAVYAWAAGAFIGAIAVLSTARDVMQIIVAMKRNFRAHRPVLSDASSDWLGVQDATKAGLGIQQGWFLGLLENLPIFVKDAVHVLICAPSRKGKTTGAVMTNLLHDTGCSVLVTDMNGNLAFQTSEHRETRLGHRSIFLNPAHRHGIRNDPYNPVQIILDDLEFSPQDAVSDAWGIARQLHAGAPGGDKDPFWPNGTRKLIAFTVLAIAIFRPQHEATLTTVYQALTDDQFLKKLIARAKTSDDLAGELSALACNIEATWGENPKHLESFREGAVQSLMPFGPSGRLAEAVSHCSFRFFEMKREKISASLICDQSRMEEYAPWIGLLIWAATRELSREPNNIRVQLILDEFTNYRLHGLPNMLTGLAALDIRCIILVQELQEIARVYGREALATVLSQCDIKQFFGFASQETALMVSKMLGDREQAGESFSLSTELGGTPGLSIAKTAKPLMTAEELRRLDDDEQIVFIRNLRPARLRKIGYQEVHPWRTEYVKPDPIHGGKPFLGRVKMRLRGQTLRATRLGTKRVKRIKRPIVRPLLAALAAATPAAPPLLLVAAIAAMATLGSPHIVYWYEYSIRGGHRYYHVCNYTGLPIIGDQFEYRGVDNCPFVIWKNIKKGGA